MLRQKMSGVRAAELIVIGFMLLHGKTRECFTYITHTFFLQQRQQRGSLKEDRLNKYRLNFYACKLPYIICCTLIELQ